MREHIFSLTALPMHLANFLLYLFSLTTRKHNRGTLQPMEGQFRSPFLVPGYGYFRLVVQGVVEKYLDCGTERIVTYSC